MFFLTTVNVGKWVLRNLFIGFIREEQRRHSQDGVSQLNSSRASSRDVLVPNSPNSPSRLRSSPELPKLLAINSGTVVSSPNMIPAVTPTVSPMARSSPLLTPLIPIHYPWRDTLSSIPQSPMPVSDATPTTISAVIQRTGTTDSTASGLPSPNILKDDYFGTRARQQPNQSSPDDFSGWTGPNKQEPQTPSTPSGIMGRLKNFGKISKRPVSDASTVSASAVVGTPTPTLVSLILISTSTCCGFTVLFEGLGKRSCAKIAQDGRTTTALISFKTSYIQRRTDTSISS